MVTRIPKSQRRRGSVRSAFTLIELLVVIAIIALLIAILLPSLEAARRQSKKSACLAHIKNIATSSRVYEADDRQGWGIPVHPLQYRQCVNQFEGGICSAPVFIGAYEWGGKSGIGQSDFVTGSPDALGIGSKYGTNAGRAFGVDSGFGPATRPMNDILYPGGFKDAWEGTRFDSRQAQKDTTLTLELFKCPGDDGPPRGAHCQDWLDNSERSSYDHFGNSYAANVFMVYSPGGCLDSSDCTGRFKTGEMGSNSPYMRPISRVPTPARTLYYEENIGRWAWSAKRELDDCLWIEGGGIDPGPTKTIRGWHCKDWEFNRAFVDAHAETQKIFIQGTEDSEGYALHYRNECPTDPAGAARCQRCIRVRGDGWQKDTMPAEFIRTQLRHVLGGRPSYEGCVGN